MAMYSVSANEMLYYITKEIDADSIEEAGERYLEMIENGLVEVNKSDLQDMIIKEVI